MFVYAGRTPERSRNRQEGGKGQGAKWKGWEMKGRETRRERMQTDRPQPRQTDRQKESRETRGGGETGWGIDRGRMPVKHQPAFILL